jgi:signal transduction histidine kinase
MTLTDALALLAQGTFLLVFLASALALLRRPSAANVDIALFFGALAFVIVETRLIALIGFRSAVLTAVTGSIVMALPYLMLRLMDDFAAVPTLIKWAAAIGLVLSVISLFVFEPPLPQPVVLGLVLYFFALALYSASAFVREAGRAHGVTRRRMQAVAAGSFMLGATILVAGLAPLAGEFRAALLIPQQLLAVGSALAYFAGFAPPTFLRRTWQEPGLRAFLARAANLPRLPTTQAIVEELEGHASHTIGATAAIGLWDPTHGILQFQSGPEEYRETRPGQLVSGRAFAEQRRILSTKPQRDAPEGAQLYRSLGIGSVIAAPITAGERRLGVLRIHAARPPIFADSDLELVGLLADQAAVILESRALIDEAASVRAREQAARLKDDFLSAAAHDLKTPLTTVLGQAQFIERQALRDEGGEQYLEGARRITQEAKRLNTLVAELLEASRLEYGGLTLQRNESDLVGVARAVCARHGDDGQACVLEADGSVVASVDRPRIEQVLENLVENAQKFTSRAAPVVIRVWQENGKARIAVRDEGIGIPAADLPRVFERFHRGANVDDRRFAGMGLGLYICRRIVEEHGGSIWAESVEGDGSTFHVAIPIGTAASVS